MHVYKIHTRHPCNPPSINPGYGPARLLQKIFDPMGNLLRCNQMIGLDKRKRGFASDLGIDIFSQHLIIILPQALHNTSARSWGKVLIKSCFNLLVLPSSASLSCEVHSLWSESSEAQVQRLKFRSSGIRECHQKCQFFAQSFYCEQIVVIS